MSTAPCRCEVFEVTLDVGDAPMPSPPREPGPLSAAIQRLQRLAEVQREQNISDRTMTSRLRLPLETVRRHQSPTCDMLLSELYRWQQALDVPVADLLVEPGPELAPAVRRRARMVKMMKTVRSLQLAAATPDVGALVEYLAEQLVEMMPELVHVDSWPLVGRRRSSADIAPIEERMLPDTALEGVWTRDRGHD